MDKSTPEKRFTDSIAFLLIIVFSTFSPWLILGGFFGVSSLRYYIKTHQCPKCHKITFSTKQNIFVRPTHESEGSAETERKCRSCGFYEKKTSSLSKISKPGSSTTESSSSFSFDSSSSHSSSSGRL